MEKYPYLVEFLRFYQQQRNSPKSTLDSYEHSIKKFFNFLLDNYGFIDPQRIERQHFVKFKEHMVNASFARDSIRLWLIAVGIYFAYLKETGRIVENKFPKLIVTGAVESLPHYVPTVAEIFRIRYKRNTRLRWATCFELLLSTGMRSDEMRKLRACDFKFGEKPIDIETGQPSKYVGGAVHLQPRLHRGKTKGSRKVFFSVLTAKLLGLYFAKYNLSPDSNLPFHPWARQNIQQWVMFLGQGVVNPFESQEEAEAGKVIQRDFSYRDIDIEDINIDPRMRELIKSRQDDANQLPDFKQAAMKPEQRRRRRNLHPHSLRHFWVCMTHYKNVFGERRSEDRIRLMAGHAVQSTTLGYLRDLDLIKTDEIWKRVWMGRPTDWMGIDDV